MCKNHHNQRYSWGVWDFVGFHQPPEFSFLLHFWATFSAGGVSSGRKLFANFPNFPKHLLDESPHSQNWPNFAIVCLFSQKRPFFGSKPLIFSKFRRFRRRNWIFFGRLRRPKCGIRTPLGQEPPRISLIIINHLTANVPLTINITAIIGKETRK